MRHLRHLALAFVAALSVAADPPSTVPSQQLSWVLAGLSTPPTQADIAAHFSEAFLAAVPQMNTVFGQLSAQTGPVTLVRVERDTPTELVAVVNTEKAGFMRILLSVEPEASHRMVGLLFQPAPDLDPKPQSWEAVDARLRAVAPKVSFLAAEITGEKCVPIHGLNPGTSLAIGSTFKLYILDQLAHDVAAGERKWTDSLPIVDAHKSLPSGDMRNEPANRTFTLQHYAQKMIAVSDNTATDHLLFGLGRDRVEAAAARAGNDSNVPFLSTREMFSFKLLLDKEKQDAYLAATKEKRRKMLKKIGAMDMSYALTAAATWDKPRHVDTVEWMASAEELCNEALVLRSYGERSPVHDILALNPGVPDDSKQWTYIGYKGGSEPGVLNLSWILQRADGRWFFMSAGFNHASAPLDEAAGIAAASGARSFLASTP